MKRIFLLFILLLFLGACTPLMKYEPPKFEPAKPIEHYKFTDIFENVPPPKQIFLKRLPDGKYEVVSKEESDLIAFLPQELNKITLRIAYYKEIVPGLEKLVNVYIDIANMRAILNVDEKMAKEVYKELYIEAYNKAIIDKRWNQVDDVGKWLIIFGQLALLLSL